MDVLSDILGAIDLRGSLYFTTEFTPPWGVRVPALRSVARFHLVMRGSFWIDIEGDDEPVRLESGDLVLVPHGARHEMRDDPQTTTIEVDEVIDRTGYTGRGALVFGGEDRGEPTRLLCGHFEFDPGASHPFLRRLPPRIVIRQEEIARHGWLDEAFRTIVHEAREGKPGCEAVIQRLSEVLFIQLVRVWAARTDREPGVMSALADPQVGRSLEAFHDAPGKPWTLPSLAREAGLSRTVFADRFQRLMAVSPMQYVAWWRVQRACALLRGGRETVEAIAASVGYESAAAFGRVFRRWTGESPGGYRRGARPDGRATSPAASPRA